MKKFVVVLLALVMALSLCMAVSARDDVKAVIEEAQGMTLEELAAKAIEESNGKMFYGVGNSSRGKSALPLFIAYLQTIDRKSTRLNSSHIATSRMPSSA